MGKTTVKVEFCIAGDSFDPNFFTKRLNILPDNIGIAGEINANAITPNGRIYKDSFWEISTGEIETLDVEIQLDRLLDRVEPQKEVLKSIVNEMPDVECIIRMIVKIVNGDVPIMGPNKRTIHFASYLDAKMDIDIYVI